MLNFLKYLSDKTFTGAELMVLTIVYKDTRFGNGCYKSVRTLADNTPFDISKSSVSNAVRSLLKKGYIERLYDESQDALYLKAVNVDCERLIKQPNNITIEHPEKVKKPKFSPPTYEDVFNKMTERLVHYFGENVQESFIECQSIAFMDYWQNLDWKDKTGCYIKCVNNRIATWAANVAQNYRIEPTPYQTTVVSLESIVNAIYAIYEPMHKSSELEWKNNHVINLIEEQARAFYSLMTKKNWRLNVGCKTWEDQLQVFAADMNCPLRVLNPGYVPKNKQEREYYNMLFGGARNIDPISEKGLETVKDIFSILDEKDAEEKARIEQHKKDVIQ